MLFSIEFCSQHIGSLFSLNTSFGNGQNGVGSAALSNNGRNVQVAGLGGVQTSSVLESTISWFKYIKFTRYQYGFGSLKHSER